MAPNRSRRASTRFTETTTTRRRATPQSAGSNQRGTPDPNEARESIRSSRPTGGTSTTGPVYPRIGRDTLEIAQT
jgi:hypothetical protein